MTQPPYYFAAPTPPPRKREVWPWVVVAVACTVGVSCLVAGALSINRDAKPTVASQTSEPGPQPTHWFTDTPENRGPEAVATTAPSAPAVAPTSKPTPVPASVAPEKVAKVGGRVRVDDVEYTLHAFKCGISSVGGAYLSRKAQGVFCRADVSVKNLGEKPMRFHADGTVKAKDGAGREFSADGEAGLYGNSDGAGFLDEINPGNRVRAYVFFDVPKGTKIKTVLFDGGWFGDDAVFAV